MELEGEIIVNCSPSERLDTNMVKGIINTIKKIDKINMDPCKVVFKNGEGLNFTKSGEHYYNRLRRRKILDSTRVSVFFEE